jgi:Bacterial Ig-like domain/Regulator of chromosome condensation (RCC1) repeat
VGLSGVTAISAGTVHSLALKGDGTVVAWGENLYGEANVPAGLSGVTAIDAGGYHNLALVGADTTAPTVTNWSPTPTASKKATVTATFSEDVQNVNTTTFKLERVIAVKKAPTKYAPVAATVTPSSGIVEKDQKATLTPTLDLPNGTYRVTLTNGVTDMANPANALDQDSTLAGNQPKVWTFKVAK